MAEHGIAITPGTGAQVRTEQIVTSYAASGIDQEVVTIGDPSNASNLALVTSTGELQATTKPGTSAALTSPTYSAADQTLLGANTARLAGAVYNGTTVVLYVRLGAVATSAAFTVALPANGYWELPGNWRGTVHAIGAGSGSGTIQVTEIS